MERLARTPERRVVLLAALALVAGVSAGATLGPLAAFAAALPVALVAYSSLLADRGALRGPGLALANVNAELTAANAALRWQVVQSVESVLRDASSTSLANAGEPAALAAAFLGRHHEPVEAILDEIAPTTPS